MATITLKDIPGRLHRELKKRALRYHRSLNREAITCLEQALGSGRTNPEELLARARDLRQKIPFKMTQQELGPVKKQGRP